MSIPNMITLVRIILTPIFVRLYLEGEYSTAAVVLAAAAMSDMLDGAVARHFGLITPLGKVLDPAADKLLQLAMLLCLIAQHPGLWMLLLLHLLRELTLGLMGALVLRRCGRLIGSHWYGKLCTAFRYVFLGAALFWREMPEKIVNEGSAVCMGLIIYCFFRYAWEYMRILHEGTIKKPT